jgi:hypothetical protein
MEKYTKEHIEKLIIYVGTSEANMKPTHIGGFFGVGPSGRTEYAYIAVGVNWLVANVKPKPLAQLTAWRLRNNKGVFTGESTEIRLKRESLVTITMRHPTPSVLRGAKKLI